MVQHLHSRRRRAICKLFFTLLPNFPPERLFRRKSERRLRGRSEGFQVGNHIGDFLRLLQARKGHSGSLDHATGVGEVSGQLCIIPDLAGAEVDHGLGILEAFGDPGLLGARELFDLPVVGMAEEAERKAAQRLGHFQQQVATSQAKLAELERFREDYQLQWINRGGQGVNGNWLVNYQRFLGQLETAMTQQRQSLAWHQNNLNNARGTWQQAYARVEGLRKLVQRYLDEARRAEDKREQQLLDELSQLCLRRDRI